jgi:hypothetical protein
MSTSSGTKQDSVIKISGLEIDNPTTEQSHIGHTEKSDMQLVCDSYVTQMKQDAKATESVEQIHQRVNSPKSET